MMKILVTGAQGFLGRGIVDYLATIQNVLIIAADRQMSSVHKENVKAISCDLFEIEDPYNYFDEPDILLHLAWRDGFSHYNESHIVDLYSHYKFLEKFFKSPVKLVSVMGSMHEVGFHEGSISEYTECNPETPYGIIKNTLRELTQMMGKTYQKNYQWLRGFYIVDNSMKGDSIFSKLIRAEQRGDKLFPFTSGKNLYDFLDYHTFCMYVCKTILQKNEYGIINICSGYPERLSERVEKFILDNNLSIKLNYGAFPERSYDSKAVWGDNRKLKKILLEYGEEENESIFEE